MVGALQGLATVSQDLDQQTHGINHDNALAHGYFVSTASR